MKKWSNLVLFLVFSIFLLFTVQAQTKPTLTILPFTGAIGGDEEAITSLLSRQEDLHKVFTMVPCSSNFNDLAVDIESGNYTRDAEIIAEIKNRLAADFALLVWADKVGSAGLTLLSMIDIGTLQQVAGDYRKYSAVRDVRGALPDITKKIVNGAQPQKNLPKFSTLPFYSGSQVRRDADILFQLLNIEATNSGKYTVFPWALIVDNFINDRNIPYYYGIVDAMSINDFGRTTDIQQVLTGDLLNQGNTNLFMASVITTEDAEFLTGGDVEYTTITDDLDAIAQLAKALIGGYTLAAVTPGVMNPPEVHPVIDPFPVPAPGPVRPVPPTASSGTARTSTVQDPSKPTLTILPFTGQTGGDEETITILLANQDELRNAFNVLPCPTNFNRLISAIESKTYTNQEDVIGALRDQLNADFTLIVRAEKVGAGNIALISLVQMHTLQQVSGNYQQYSGVREVRSSLPDIAQKVAASAQTRPNLNLPKLTVLPFYTPSGVEVKDADILFQYLTIELANSGKYVVYPWALPIETLVRDFKIPYFGIIDPNTINAFGTAAKIQYVLTGDLLNLGTTNLFMSSIVYTEDAKVLNEGDLEYRLLMEDMGLVTELSNTLIYGRFKPAATPAQAPAERDPWSVAETVPPKESSRPTVSTTLPKEKAVETEPFKDMVKVPAGTYTMGTPAGEVGRDSDEIQHSVQVASFYLAKNEVTQAEYQAVMGTNPSFFTQYPTLPVEQVNWFEAVTYCNARSIKEGLTPAYIIQGETVTWNRQANGYRLPTETEWEYACRGGTAATFYTGNNFSSEDGNFDGNYAYNNNPKGIYRERTMPVGSFKPNAWGLYDMHGNVYEWCWDWYEPYNAGNRSGYLSANRIVRGGSWYSEARYLRSGNRVQVAPVTRVYYVGFRVARNIPN